MIPLIQKNEIACSHSSVTHFSELAYVILFCNRICNVIGIYDGEGEAFEIGRTKVRAAGAAKIFQTHPKLGIRLGKFLPPRLPEPSGFLFIVSDDRLRT